LPAWLPADFPRTDELGVNVPVVLFAASLSLVTGLLCGVLPIVGLSRANISDRLLNGGRGATNAAAMRVRGGAPRTIVLGGQVAIASVLLAGAFLLTRSFESRFSVDRGYDPSNVITARVSFPGSLFTPERRYEAVGAILERAAALPGVTQAAFTSEMPLTRGGSTASFQLHLPNGEQVAVQVSPRLVARHYFDALRMRIVEGRAFGPEDVLGAEPAIVINAAFSRRFLNARAVGTRMPMALGYGNVTTMGTVIGVVDDVRYLSDVESAEPEIFYAFEQMPGRLPVPVATLLLRTGANVEVADGIRDVVRDVDSRLVAEGVLPFEQRLLTLLARPRLYAGLMTGFAVLAVVITGVGLFGVLTVTVTERTREIAVRTALGATPATLVWLVARQALLVTSAGLAVGLPLAFWAGQLSSSLLYGISAADPVTFAAVPFMLVLLTMIAAAAPAWRASRVDPAKVLNG
jgi:predicted permease